jgi:hypothetical protein
MTDARSAWNDTGEQLTALGSKLGAHFDRQRGADGEQAREQAEEALKRLGEAVKDAFEAVGAAARDQAVQQDATFREVSDEVRKAFDRTNADAPASAGEEPKTPPAAASPPEPQDPKDP